MKKKILLSGVVAGFLLITSSVFAQDIATQYFMNIPQTNTMNPAFRPNSKIYIGLPVLSNFSLNMSNNFLSFDKIFQPMEGTDSVMTILHPDYDREKFLNSIGRKGFVSAEIGTQLLGIGITVADDWYIDFGLAVKGSMAANIPADLFTLVLEGNEGFIGSSIDLSGMGFNAQAYLESSVGISKNITNKLRVGGRFKLYMGAMNASLTAEQLEIEVNDDFSHALHTDLVMRFNAPVDVSFDDDDMIKDILFREDLGFSEVGPNASNIGVGIDLGATYDLMDNLSLSASIIDFGFINWGSESFELRANNSFSFDGFDITSVITEEIEFDVMMEDFADSLLNSFDFVDTEDKYNSGLPTKIFLGANYRPLDFIGLGVLSRTTFNQGLRQSLTFSANLYAGDILSTHLSYTMINRTFNNFGFGLGLKAGPFQFYTVVDQLPASWIKMTDSSGEDDFNLMLPNRVDYMNLRFGMNLVFGRMNKKKKVDTPMLTE